MRKRWPDTNHVSERHEGGLIPRLESVEERARGRPEIFEWRAPHAVARVLHEHDIQRQAVVRDQRD